LSGVRCGHCREIATWRILWAGGRAWWATCDAHKGLGIKTIKRNGKWAEIVKVERIS
jgi:hypothetical protein